MGKPKPIVINLAGDNYFVGSSVQGSVSLELSGPKRHKLFQLCFLTNPIIMFTGLRMYQRGKRQEITDTWKLLTIRILRLYSITSNKIYNLLTVLLKCINLFSVIILVAYKMLE